MQVVCCYFCGSRQSDPYDTENGYCLVKCRGCGLLYVDPRPDADEIDQAAQTGRHRGDELLDVTGRFDDSKLPRYRRILADFFPAGYGAGTAWLDIGCGHGEFLGALRDFAAPTMRLRGCEPNAGKIASARLHGLDVDFFDLGAHEERYDGISMLNVFSHLPDPRQLMGRWLRLLKPGGSLFLETGHSCHLPSRLHHRPYYLPDHLSFANRPIVEQLLRDLGLEIERTRIYRHTVFPELTARTLLDETLKRLRGRPNQLAALFPRHPKRDMFVHARLVKIARR
jgi:SAM-dependent methyltransferase